MKRTFYPVLQVLLAALLFGASAPLAKILLGTIDPVALAAFLYLGSGLGAWLFFFAQQVNYKGQPAEAALAKTDIPWLLGASLSGGVAAPILLMWGLNQTPASTASLLLNFESVATTLIAVFIFREAVDRRILWAIGLITLATILASWTGGQWGVSFGALGILGACFLWGVDNNLTRQISAKNPLVIVGVKGLAAGSFSMLLTCILAKPTPAPITALLSMLLGAVSYGLSIFLFILAMRGLGAARTSTLFGIAPFIGTILSLILLHEVPQILFWAAIPIMLAGAWLMLTEHHDHHHIHESIEHAHAHAHDAHHAHEHLPNTPSVINGMHNHWHVHNGIEHNHSHTPDLHHRHEHASVE